MSESPKRTTRKSSRLRNLVATATTVVIVSIGTVGAACSCETPVFGGGGGAETATIWVDDDGGTCVDNASAVSYSDATACTLDAANDTCDNGETVMVKGGSYAAFNISGSNSRSTDCQFQTVDGEVVSVADSADFSGSKLTWSGDGSYGSSFTVTGGVATTTTSFQAQVSFNSSASFITANDWKAVPGNVWMAGDDITINDAEWGGYDTASSSEHDGLLTSIPEPARVVLDGIYVHDIGRASGAQHTDCMHIRGFDTLTIRNSRIVNCPTTGLLIQLCCGATTQNDLTIENNVLGPMVDGSVMVNLCNTGETMDNLVLRYNTISSGYDNTCASGTQTIKGNIFSGIGNCAGPGTYSHNVWGSSSCGSNSFTCTPSFVSGTDKHLQSGDTCARSRGDTASHPSADFDGDLRPMGTVDIGADEIS